MITATLAITIIIMIIRPSARKLCIVRNDMRDLVNIILIFGIVTS